MKVAIAIDSFKGSLSSLQAGEAIKKGVNKVFPDAEVSVNPLADGGEGTVEALTLGMGGRLIKTTVCGPLGKPVPASYGVVDESGIAIIEMAAAAGITLVSEKDRNPLYTTTYGVGELIRDAIDKGCRRFIIGIGGSATNDGGVGMLQALGCNFLDESGESIPFGAIGLKDLKTINLTNMMPQLKECTFRVACDVTNPLCGENGCSAIYGPQKGATPDMVKDMDEWLADYARLSKNVLKDSDVNAPGAGAAGGLGFAFMAYLGAKLESGIGIVLDETRLEDKIKGADLVITGEGRIDSQTVMGKAPIGVAHMAKKYGIPVIAMAGCLTEDAYICNEHGIDAIFPILRSVVTLDEALDSENAKKNLTATAEQLMRLYKISS